MPRLKGLVLVGAAIGDAALAALAPALRRRPALNIIDLSGNPFGDEGIAALVPPPPPAGTPPPPAGALKNLALLYVTGTEITDAGCAALAAALSNGALPVLWKLKLDRTPASDEAKEAVNEAIVRLPVNAALAGLPPRQWLPALERLTL